MLPSANGLNWGGHTIGIMRELGALMRKELDIDANHLALSGHSMGGMGITRNYLWLADEFSFFLPMAAGMDIASFKTPDSLEQQLNKQFNVPYIHLQGLFDSFQIFVERCKAQLSATQNLEQKYGIKSKLKILFYDTDHNYIYSVFRDNAAEAFKTSRNLYQKELWGSLLTRDNFVVDNNITYRVSSDARYFWLEAIESDLTKGERIDVHAKIEGNDIKIELNAGTNPLPTQTHKLRVYLSSEMEDLSKPLKVYVNGVLMATRAGTAIVSKPRSMDPTDPSFLFEDSIDVEIGSKTK